MRRSPMAACAGPGATPVIKHLCVALTRCRLYARRPEGERGFARAVRRECDAARKMLATIAAGARCAGATAPAGESEAAAPERVFAGGEF